MRYAYAHRMVATLMLVAASVVLTLGAAPATAPQPSAPPQAPPGYKSTDEVKEAIRQHRVKLIDLLIPVPPSIARKPNLEYGKVDDQPLQLDLYQPKWPNQSVPALILIHGGGWKSGERRVYHYYCVKLAEQGYVTATMSYRLSTDAPYPAAVQDAKCAVRWLRANAAKYRVNPEKIGVLGGSAGGHLAMMVGYSAGVESLEGEGGNPGVSSRVQAVIDFYGPTDLTADAARNAGVVIQFMGGQTYEQAEAQYREASPITHLTKNAPPTLILHGTIDDTVPIAQADLLAGKLKELRVPFEYERLEGWPHTMDLAEEVNRRCLWRIQQFLAKHLPLPPGAATRPASAPAD